MLETFRIGGCGQGPELDEYEANVFEERCPAALCKALIRYEIAVASVCRFVISMQS